MLPFISRSQKRRISSRRYTVNTDDNDRFSVSKVRVDYTYPKEYPSGHYQPLMLIGEAPGAEEEYRKRPFVGISGTTLNGWMEKAGLKRDEALIANTFRYRPEKNDVKRFFRPAGYPNVKLCLDLAPKTGLYLAEQFRPDIEHLKKTLLDFRPEVVITLGQTALWCVLNQDVSISRLIEPQQPHFCNITIEGKHVRFMLLPAYHPAAFLRTKDESYERITIGAFKKAKSLLRPASL